MLCKVRSLGLQGISGYEVTAECDLAGGLPNFDIVGLPDTAVKEARERVRAAIRQARPAGEKPPRVLRLDRFLRRTGLSAAAAMLAEKVQALCGGTASVHILSKDAPEAGL